VTSDLVIRGGFLVGPDGVVPSDVVVEQGRIAAVTAPGAGGSARRIISADGLHVFPGAIDAHVHFDAPGRDHWEGWATGSLAAAAGGVTTVVDMPIDSDPPTIDAESVALKRDAAMGTSLIDFALWGGLVPQNMHALEPLLSAGVVGLKAFTCDSGWPEFPAANVDVLSAGMEAAARAGVPVAVHCEDADWFGPEPWDRPIAAEVQAVKAAAASAARHGAHLHVVHCSSAAAVLEAKRWLNTTVETCPHYLTLSAVEASQIGPDALCHPPLRDAENLEHLWQLLEQGAIDTIASDHSPCPPQLKEGPTPFAGISGVETALSVLLTTSRLPVGRLSQLRTAAAALCGLHRKGAIAEGYDADLALVDLQSTWQVSSETLHDRHRRSPFLGRELVGVVQATLVRGVIVYQSGGPASEPTGSWVR
jgi:allantoinase